MKKKVAVIMGSDSDLPVVKGAIGHLKILWDSGGSPCDERPPHPRTGLRLCPGCPEKRFWRHHCGRGEGSPSGRCFGGPHRLAGDRYPHQILHPGWVGALLATVQMPKGIPVATVAIDGADNAGILAAQMLALSDEEIAAQLDAMKEKMTQDVLAKDAAIQSAEF